ncbi:MAG: FAD-binding protein [Nitrospirae bacterium]|nr:FAD-binding protein [Nitrospirota bacterium]
MLDAVIIGSGGAGLSAAIELGNYTDNFLLITRCALGQSNTMMAKGGIQIAVGANDSLRKHFNDSLAGGNYKNDEKLLHLMISKSRGILKWLNELGMDFDKMDDSYDLRSCTGISEKRVLSRGAETGSAIMKVLLDRIKRSPVNISINTSLEGIKKKKEYFLLKTCRNGRDGLIETKNVILCCGGRSNDFARQHKMGTTNQPCTSSGFYHSLRVLNLAMRDANSFQLHPACISLKGPLLGTPVPETLLSLGGMFYNKTGKKIADARSKRDILSKQLLKIIRNNMGIKEGLAYKSVYLDLRNVFVQNSVDSLKSFSNFLNKLSRSGVDPRTDLIPVAPMVHYQNGGIAVNSRCETSVPGIYAAGEITGGIHGTNRLMGNSLLDILVFGNIAGRACGKSITKRRIK